MRRFVAFLGPVALALAGACHDFDTQRQAPPRGTIGEEVYGVFCDRLAGQLLREDLSGASFESVCHRGNGDFSDGIDESALPPVSADEQKKMRERAVARIGALVRRRTELIAALDGIFPEGDVRVLDIKNPDPKKTCGPAEGNQAVRRFGSEIADMLARLSELYNDDTLPASTRSLARVLDFFRRNTEAQASIARFSGREGYPPDIDIGVARPLLSYPGFRDLAAETLRLVAYDSDPYAADAPRNPDGSRQRVPGAGYASFNKLLEVAHEELRTTTIDKKSLLKVTRDASINLDRLSRPRENLEVMTQLFFVQDASLGGGEPHFIAKRDPRGFAAVSSIEAPFVDKDGDKLPDIDLLGRFLTVNGDGAPTPFPVAGGKAVQRDEFGRVQVAGKPLYDYVDTSHNLGAQLLADVHALSEKNDVLMNALGGAYVAFGKRSKGQKEYAPDPGRVDRWHLTHDASDPPPSDLGTKAVVVDFNGFDPATAPLVDFVHATGVSLGDRSIDDLLQMVRLLITDHAPLFAALVGDMLEFQDIANKHPEAKIKADSLFWDEVLDMASDMVKDRALLEDVLLALAEPAFVKNAQAFAGFMANTDHISYDRNDINGDSYNLTTKSPSISKTPVDRGKPDTGDNRSQFQRLVHIVNDGDGVALCNKDGTIVHAKGVPLAGSLDMPLFGSYKECEVVKIDNLSKFYLGTIVGKSKFNFRPTILRQGIAGIGAATVDTMQQSAGLQGFWDPPDAMTFRPKPAMINRMVFFDQQNDSVNSGPNHTTNAFLRDLLGPHTGSALCQERIIDDPDPTAIDASSDGKVRGLRSCAPGQWIEERHKDALFVLEHFDAYAGLAPLIKPFADHDREDLLIHLFKTIHRHYQSQAGLPPECDPNIKSAAYCSRSGISSYEPLFIEALTKGILTSLHELAVVLANTTVPRCTSVDADTGLCKLSQPVNGTTVFADATEALINPDRAREAGIKDRKGQVTAQRNDGTTNPQVTPIYLMVQALKGVDAAFAEDAKDPANLDRQQRWREARSAIVDRTFGVTGEGAQARFDNPIVTRVLPTVIDVLRAQLWAHCPETFVAPYKRCTWAREELHQKLVDSLRSPTFTSSMDVLDVIRKDESALVGQLTALISYLTDPASRAEALASSRAAMTDMMQVLQNDEDLVPVYHIMAEAMGGSLRDDLGNIIEAGMIDAQTSLVSRLAARHRDAEGANICSREINPNQVLTLMLKNLVTPMKQLSGDPGRTPFDVVVDVIGDVNRTDPTKEGRLEPSDFADVSKEVGEFFVDKERGLEQFYRIIKNGTQ